MPDVHILTLGCPKNTVASRRLEKALSRLGATIIDSPDEADAVIVNTCGFVEAAKEESIECLLGLDKGRHGLSRQKIIAVGCLTERYRIELTKALPEIDSFLGFGELCSLPAILDLPGELELDLPAHDGSPTAYLEISDGCSKSCTFCAIPGIRGAYRSYSEKGLLAEARYLAEQGCLELVLVGQDTGAYGIDLLNGPDLPDLIDSLSLTEGIEWLRLLYLQPQHVTDKLIETIANNGKVCPYLDIPVQHGSPKVISAMNRWGDGETYLRIFERLRRRVPDIALRTSVIVGFPGENRADLRALAEFLTAADLDYVGIFEFSAEEGTPAARLKGQISGPVKTERANQIKALVDEISSRRRGRFVGRELDVLIDSKNNGVVTGHTPYQAPDIDGDTFVTGTTGAVGDIVRAKIESQDDYELRGRAVQ